jgi:hypothetical protein
MRLLAANILLLKQLVSCRDVQVREPLSVGRQNIDDLPGAIVRLLTAELAGAHAYFAGRRHRIEDAGDNLRGARAAHFVRRFRFEQLRVGQDDPELVVEAG